MHRCPISYKPVDAERYHPDGLKMLSPKLGGLEVLPFTQNELRQEAVARASKMSVQGVQAKLSAVLSASRHCFEIVSMGGVFILKPQSDLYPNLPENEDLTMRMAALVGIEVPLHGMIYAKDGSLVYFVRRFDRFGRGKKYPQEDFAQLTGHSRDTKYGSSMEKVAAVVDEFCTFPVVEKLKLFQRVLFCFLTGNEDMHLKNFSLTTRQGKTALTPAYDLLNTTIALKDAKEELALPIRGKKNRITRADLIDYYAIQRLGIQPKAVDRTLMAFATAKPSLLDIIRISFLPDSLKEAYIALLEERFARLGLA